MEIPSASRNQVAFKLPTINGSFGQRRTGGREGGVGGGGKAASKALGFQTGRSVSSKLEGVDGGGSSNVTL